MLAGVVTVKDAQLAEQLNQFHNMIGATLSPLDSYLLQRGLKTLHLRIERSQENAQKLHNDVVSQIQLMKFYIADEQACLV